MPSKYQCGTPDHTDEITMLPSGSGCSQMVRKIPTSSGSQLKCSAIARGIIPISRLPFSFGSMLLLILSFGSMLSLISGFDDVVDYLVRLKQTHRRTAAVVVDRVRVRWDCVRVVC